MKFIVMVMDIGWALTDYRFVNWGGLDFAEKVGVTLSPKKLTMGVFILKLYD